MKDVNDLPTLHIPEPLNKLMSDMWRDVQKRSLEAAEEAATRDPKAHKLTRVFANGQNYVYTPAGKTARGATVRFCRSTQRNVAGYFLCWREVETPSKKKAKKVGDLVSTTKRDQFAGFKSKKSAIALCRRRAAAFRKRRSPARPGG